MRNPEWVALTDAQRGHLVAIWLLAADHDGVIPASPAIIRKLCYLDDGPDLKLLIDLNQDLSQIQRQEKEKVICQVG